MTEHTRIEAYLPRLYGYAVSLAGDHHQAEDLVQECALRALAAKNTPGDEPAYRAWLFRILRNAFLDRRRREKTAALSADEVNFAPDMEFWQGDERLISILAVKLQMAKLPRRHREIVALIDIVGLSYAEAARLLEVPVGTVMSRISRARRLVLTYLATHFGVDEQDWQGLPPGPEREQEFYSCQACHSLAIVKQQGLSRETWDESLIWMVEKQAMPRLEPDDRELILDYLATHYGLDSSRRRRKIR